MVPWRWRPKSIYKAPAELKTQTIADDVQEHFQRNKIDTPRPEQQSALLLHAIRQPYEVTIDHAIPEIHHDSELLVKVTAVGLNPIDWKAP